ncbi:MAG: septum formation protein Maf [Desulfovibrio sp.]|nr:septum formation protein Maf [Desulfovibrio sp.]
MVPLFRLAPGLRLLLASASPRRRQFLEEWGLPFTLVRPGGIEPSPASGETPAAYACRAARAKAHAAAASLTAQERTGSLILSADTVVTLTDDILGKPHDAAHALTMLERLAGRDHNVISAVCLLLPDGQEELFSDVSRVFFHPWPRSVLQAYTASGEPDDKAGAYAIQGQGAFLVERIEGSWSTVVGLPVTPLARILLERGCMLPVS